MVEDAMAGAEVEPRHRRDKHAPGDIACRALRSLHIRRPWRVVFRRLLVIAGLPA